MIFANLEKMKPILFFLDDDYPTNVYNEIIVRKLVEVGSFKIFNDSLNALKSIKAIERKPNIIFLDINMPKMNGWEFVEEIEKSPSDFLTPPYCIVMLTTSLSSHDVEKGKKSPLVKTLLEKPLTKEKILDVINSD